MDDDPLAAAAWAGYYRAHGKHAEAERWAAAAREMMGRVLTQMDRITVRVRGEAPALDELDLVLETLAIYRRGLERKAAREAEPAPPPAPSGGPGPGAE